MRVAATLTSSAIYRLLNMIIVYAIVVVVSRLAGVAGYGLLSLMIVNVTLFNMVSGFGSDAGITYHSANTSLQTGKIIAIIFWVVLLQVMLLGVTELIFYFFKGHYWIADNNFASYWWMGILLLLSISLTEKYTALFNGHYLFTLCNRLLLLSNLLVLAVFCFLLICYPVHEAKYLVAVYVVLYLLQSLVLVVTFHRHLKAGMHLPAVSATEIKSFLSFSSITLVTNIIQFLAYKADYWFIAYYRGEQELGWYALSVRLVQVFWILPLMFAGILFPQVAREKTDYEKHKMNSFIRMLFFVNMVAGIALFAGVQWLIPALFGEMYRNSIAPFRVLLPGIILFCHTTILAAYFAGRGLLRINLRGSLVSFCSILFLDVILIPAYGMKGAAIASSIGYSITTAYFIIVYCRQAGIRINELFYLLPSDWHYFRNFIYKTLFKRQG